MLSIGIAQPEQLTVLTKALGVYCHAAEIEPGTREYEDAGRLVMSLFNNGVTSAEELAAALNEWSSRAERYG